jgi:hypothetical protein
VQSGAVWASTSPVAVDGESWTLLLRQVQEQGIRWQTTVSDGGRAIEEAVSTVTPKLPHQRDVWHVLHLCQQVQARLDRQVEGLQQRKPVERIRKERGGQKNLVEIDATLLADLEQELEPKGDPMSLLQWTTKSLDLYDQASRCLIILFADAP